MDREEAEALSILLLQVIGRLDQSASYVRDKETKANWDEYRHAVGPGHGYRFSRVGGASVGSSPRTQAQVLGRSLRGQSANLSTALL